MSEDGRITDDDLHAYVDGQLDAARRVEVQAHLERHPERAAAVMRDLRLRDELRLFLLAEGEGWPAPARTQALGRRLAGTCARASLRASLAPPFRAALAAAALIALGWFGHARLGGPTGGGDAAERPADALADEAAQAYRVAVLRLAAAGSGAAGGTPPRPGGLRRVALETVSWEGGTAELELLVGPGGDTLLLLAARTDTPDVERPAVELVDGVPTVSWQSGSTAYALSGEVPASDLLAIASSLAPTS